MPCDPNHIDFGSNLDCDLQDYPDGLPCSELNRDNINQVLAMLKAGTDKNNTDLQNAIDALNQAIDDSNCITLSSLPDDEVAINLAYYLDSKGCIKFVGACADVTGFVGDQSIDGQGLILLSSSVSGVPFIELTWNNNGDPSQTICLPYSEFENGTADIDSGGEDSTLFQISSDGLTMSYRFIGSGSSPNFIDSIVGKCSC